MKTKPIPSPVLSGEEMAVIAFIRALAGFPPALRRLAFAVSVCIPCVVHSSPEMNLGSFNVRIPINETAVERVVQTEIDQEEGKIQLPIKMIGPGGVRIVSSSVELTGCDSRQVRFYHLWLEDPSNSEYGQMLDSTGRFYAWPNPQGSLIAVFKGLSGCKRLKYTVRLKRD